MLYVYKLYDIYIKILLILKIRDTFIANSNKNIITSIVYHSEYNTSRI